MTSRERVRLAFAPSGAGPCAGVRADRLLACRLRDHGASHAHGRRRHPLRRDRRRAGRATRRGRSTRRASSTTSGDLVRGARLRPGGGPVAARRERRARSSTTSPSATMTGPSNTWSVYPTTRSTDVFDQVDSSLRHEGMPGVERIVAAAVKAVGGGAAALRRRPMRRCCGWPRGPAARGREVRRGIDRGAARGGLVGGVRAAART